MLTRIIVATICILPMPAAGEVYRCEIDGKKVFQAKPCKGVETQKVDIYIPSAPERTVEQKREADNYFEQKRLQRAEKKARLNAEYEARRKKNERYRRFNELIKQNTVAIGMTAKQAVEAWGKPCDKNRSIYKSGVNEQWVYCRGEFERHYIYVDDGIVTSIQK